MTSHQIKVFFRTLFKFKSLRLAMFSWINADIPKSTKFHHFGMSVVIGEGSKVGENCHIYHCVTLGDRYKIGKKTKHQPILEDNVTIYPFSMVLGEVTVGRHSVIAAYSLVLDDVPPYSVVSGRPAKVINTLKNNE